MKVTGKHWIVGSKPKAQKYPSTLRPSVVVEREADTVSAGRGWGGHLRARVSGGGAEP